MPLEYMLVIYNIWSSELRDKLAIAERTAKTESQLKVGYQCAGNRVLDAFGCHICCRASNTVTFMGSCICC